MSYARALLKHGVPASAGAILGVLGLQLGFLFSGIVVIEKIFVMPGIGDLLYQAILNRDNALASYIIGVTSLFIVTINSSVDLIIYRITPGLQRGYDA